MVVHVKSESLGRKDFNKSKQGLQFSSIKQNSNYMANFNSYCDHPNYTKLICQKYSKVFEKSLGTF